MVWWFAFCCRRKKFWKRLMLQSCHIKSIIPLQAKRPILRKNVDTNFVLK